MDTCDTLPGFDHSKILYTHQPHLAVQPHDVLWRCPICEAVVTTNGARSHEIWHGTLGRCS